MIYKPRMKMTIHVPKFGSRTEALDLQPRIISAKWTRNNHLKADELTVGIGWKEGGVEPRLMKNATCGFWLWDAIEDGEEPANDEGFLRFTGVGHKATRKLTENGWVVEIDFLDYTSFFINMRPFPSAGMPEWSDTLPILWQKICDNVGFKDPATGKIVSSVEALRDKLDILIPGFENVAIGQIINPRFHAVSKPTVPTNADAWAVWQYMICALGLISYIDKDRCIVTDTTEHYRTAEAPHLIQGENIYEFEEASDSGISNKGVLLKSFDPLAGHIIEAVYPPPGDDRLKQRRAVARRSQKEGRDPSLNELSGDYEEFESFDVTTQAALDRKAEKVYEERKRQEMQGRIKTMEMRLTGPNGEFHDVFDLTAGDPVMVSVDQESRDVLDNVLLSDEDRVRYLTDCCGYVENLARIIVQAAKQYQLKAPVFHIKQIAVDFGPDKFDVEIEYHNLIVLD